MFADAAVYGVSLYVVGRGEPVERRAARVAGGVEMVLAVTALAEVARRFFVGSAPEPGYMIGIASLALLANITCMVLLAAHRQGGAHMKASWIFSINDVLANLGVIVAGALVWWTGSNAAVFSGAIRILRLA